MIDFGDRKAILDQIARIDVRKDHLLIRFITGEETDSSDQHLLPAGDMVLKRYYARSFMLLSTKRL